MKEVKCTVCSKKFKSNTGRKTCSPECQESGKALLARTAEHDRIDREYNELIQTCSDNEFFKLRRAFELGVMWSDIEHLSSKKK